MGSHILISANNLKITGVSAKLKCLYCNRATDHKVGYLGSLCLECDLNMFDFDSFKDVYNHIKRKYDLQRKDISKLLNLTPNTISTYQSDNINFLVVKLLKLHLSGEIKTLKASNKSEAEDGSK